MKEIIVVDKTLYVNPLWKWHSKSRTWASFLQTMPTLQTVIGWLTWESNTIVKRLEKGQWWWSSQQHFVRKDEPGWKRLVSPFQKRFLGVSHFIKWQIWGFSGSRELNEVFKKIGNPGLFFFIFVFSIQLMVYIILPITWISGTTKCSTNGSTTTCN